MRYPSKDSAPVGNPVWRLRFMVTLAMLSALLCAGLGLSLVSSAPASSAQRECPGITWLGADSVNTYYWRNGIWCYIGHDEPAVNFYSTVKGSGSNMTWELILPNESSATPTFEDYIHFQLTLALCDPNSTNQARVGACTPNSDTNIASGPNYSGAALLELKFIPPGEPLQPGVGLSCSNQTTTGWCAVMQVQVENSCPVANPAVLNEGWVTTNGQPPQPVYSGNFSPPGAGANTFIMNSGDRIRVVLTDTANGLLAVVVDETTKTTGFVLASSANGFSSLTPLSPAPAPNCTVVPATFRPLWNTATTAHIIPWALANLNVQFALETGHFEIQNTDADDPTPCGTPTTSPVIANGCFGTDSDFDGQPYQSGAWPPGPAGSQSVQITSVSGTGIGPTTSNQLYAQLQFETTFRATLGTNGTMASLIGTTVGNNTNFFYPYYSQLKPGITVSVACELVIGNYASGANVTNNFGKQGQYDGGTGNSGENAGSIIANPCPK